ncbi:MAG: 2-C-methyl-D-erythritol 4-phosphate cytidylyltransferase [Mariprofundaceae bacterium]|nr:2-C-methyl-D-erythritol 4-phosphate cytidylyltransferase [Mariprofundaceae bacterium]
MQVTVVLLIAGSGRRLGSDIPKQYIEVNGKALLLHCLQHLSRCAQIKFVKPVIAQDDSYYHSCIAQHDFSFTLLNPVVGGSERVYSMQAGLNALSQQHEWVAIHDAARPLVEATMLNTLFKAAAQHGAAAPALHVIDTIKKIDANGFVLQTPERQSLRAVQTPQVARKAWFEDAFSRLGVQLNQVTDDMSLLEACHYPVFLSEGHPNNRKITMPEDLTWLKQTLDQS